MQAGRKDVVWFKEVGKGDVGIVGGKGANLGEMTNAGIPVPPGFIVTADAYFHFIKVTNLMDKIRSLLEPVDVDDSRQLQNVAAEVRNLIATAKMVPEIAEKIKQCYKEMGGGFVAVRSSATAEDLPEASFAGQQRTFLNITGAEEVVEAVQDCWASLFEARAIFYRVQQGFDHFKVGIAVPVQRMVQSEAAGVMFTLEPVSSDTTKIAIEAVLGLGEMIVSGDVTPDTYIVDKDTMTITKKEIAAQEWKMVRRPEGGKGDDANMKIDLTLTEQKAQKITDAEVVALAKIGKSLEDHYNYYQDIEWARDEDDNLYIVQTRPVTTLKEGGTSAADVTTKAPVLISGAPASPGIASGIVKVLADASECDKVLDGDILVAEMTTPDYVPAMKRASAIITDRGGRTAHAAIVSRELGIPCVVGTGDATQVLKDNQILTVDGYNGNVYDGKIDIEVKVEEIATDLETKMNVYANLAQPEIVDRVAARNVDGIGLLRAEFMMAQIGEHPRYIIEQKREQEYIDKLAEGITTFAKAFNPRPVVYRTTDFKTNEYRELKGGEKYELPEENPMLGFRGASRYIADPEVFKMEIAAIKKVRETYKNLYVMIPFVRTVKELVQTKAIMEAEGLKRSDDFKLWMMVEIPANVLLIDKFIAVGIDGISIGSNDLTQLTLGVDRDSEKLAETFDEMNEAVLMALEMAVRGARKLGKTVSVCGQGPSVYPELTEMLAMWGATSVSVSPDMIDVTRNIIAKVEAKLNG
ncbi:phosphoenolpyruvate synthase [Chloroflexota bacterium]